MAKRTNRYDLQSGKNPILLQRSSMTCRRKTKAAKATTTTTTPRQRARTIIHAHHIDTSILTAQNTNAVSHITKLIDPNPTLHPTQEETPPLAPTHPEGPKTHTNNQSREHHTKMETTTITTKDLQTSTLDQNRHPIQAPLITFMTLPSTLASTIHATI